MSLPDWKEALPKPPSGAQLVEAWFTTYDQPDPGLLVEHLLPALLKLDNSLTPETSECKLYFGELGMALEKLRGRFTVISSPPRNRKFKNDGEEAETDVTSGQQSSPYPWLWRYVSHFTVGANTPAVQHAKLWAFHWKDGNDDFLELHVSSRNLTASAFKSQIQAGWNTLIRLENKFTKSRQQGWGNLTTFLDALGNSAGENAKERISRLSLLLGRAVCPGGITFVVSIPDTDKRAAHVLRKLKPSAIHILTPTIGDWEESTLKSWSKDIGVKPENIHLKWIDENHPWKQNGGWALTRHTAKVLQKSIKINHLEFSTRFTDEHVYSDDRWSHAKLYLLRVPKKKKRYLLLTSANWSASAWGAGKSAPRNFELGVLFETDWKMLEEISGTLHQPFCSERKREGNGKLHWAEAAWDGKRIALCARSTDIAAPINVIVTLTEGMEKSVQLAKGDGSITWNDAKSTPLTAQFTQGTEALEVNVLDLRPSAEFAMTPLPEVDPAIAQALREAFLLERYGGSVVDPDYIPGLRGEHKPVGNVTSAADYSVQAWIDARDAFNVVDQWSGAFAKAKTMGDASHIQRVLMDGNELRNIYKQRGSPAAILAAEELTWHLKGSD